MPLLDQIQQLLHVFITYSTGVHGHVSY